MDRDGPVEIDVAALRESSGTGPGELATPQTWTPPAPAVSVAIELPADDAVEVQVFADDGDPRLTAVIELLSPRNKDRPANPSGFRRQVRQLFAAGEHFVVVDTVTTHRADLNASILSLLKVDTNTVKLPAGLSAVSYRAVGQDAESQQLLLWPASLTLGQPLPTLPLWIAADFSVPLDLEASYQATCTDLRICQAR